MLDVILFETSQYGILVLINELYFIYLLDDIIL